MTGMVVRRGRDRDVVRRGRGRSGCEERVTGRSRCEERAWQWWL